MSKAQVTKKSAAFKVEKASVAEVKAPNKKKMPVSKMEVESESDSDGSDADFASEQEEYSEEEYQVMSDGEEEEETGEGNEEQGEDGTTESKPKKSKSESRQEAKKLKLERQSHKPNFDLIQSAKKLWEFVRRKDLKAEKRQGPLSELYKVLTGKFKQVILQHDASRMVQTCVKYGSLEQRMQVATELKGAFVEVSKSRYGKHIVKRLLQYCPKVRDTIASEFRGKVGKIIRHKDASAIVELLYTEYSNGAEKNMLMYEFYGPEFVLFKSDNGKNNLSDIFAKYPEKREAILKKMRDSLDGLMNKGSIHHTIIHRLMLEYVTFEETKRVQDWLTTIEEYLVEVLHSFEGARVVSKLVAFANAKQRKSLIKSFKQYLTKIASEEYGHQVLLTVFALVDDTVLVKSSLLQELCKDLDSHLKDKYARRLFLSLLGGDNPANLSKQAIEVVNDAKQIAATCGTSKKDSIVRAEELRSEILSPMIEYCQRRFEALLQEPTDSLIILETVLAELSASESALFTEKIAATLFSAEALESADTRAFLKKLARRCTSPNQYTALISALKPHFDLFTSTESVYILMALISNDQPEIKAALKSAVNLKKLDAKNQYSRVLLEKLN